MDGTWSTHTSGRTHATSGTVDTSHGMESIGTFRGLASKWKNKGVAHRKGEFSLRMNPPPPAPAPSGSPSPSGSGGGGSSKYGGPVGVPVREILQQIYHHKRDKTVHDCWIYFMFTVIFVAVVYQINNTQDSFSTNAAIFNLLLDQEYDTLGTITYNGPEVQSYDPSSQQVYYASEVDPGSDALGRGASRPPSAGVPGGDPGGVYMSDPIDAFVARAAGHFPAGSAAYQTLALSIQPELLSLNFTPALVNVSDGSSTTTTTAAAASVPVASGVQLSGPVSGTVDVGATAATPTGPGTGSGLLSTASLQASLSGTARLQSSIPRTSATTTGARAGAGAGVGVGGTLGREGTMPVGYAVPRPPPGAAGPPGAGSSYSAQVTIANTYAKTFFDITTFEELRDWLVGPFIDNMYPQQWYNGDALSEEEKGFIANGMLKLVQGVRLWQVRVSKTPCSMVRTLQSAAMQTGFARVGQDEGEGTCYGPFMPGRNEFTSPYGPSWNSSMFKWSSKIGTPLEGLDGWGVSDYGTGGYVAFLGANASDARATLAQLMEARWLDKSTRALGIDFNLYNPDTNLLSVVRLLVEMLPTGFVLTSYKMYTYKAQLYNTGSDFLRAAGELCVCVGVMYYLFVEMRQLMRSRPRYKYFSDPTNAFDLALQGLMIICIGYWAAFISRQLGADRDLRALIKGTYVPDVTSDACRARTAAVGYNPRDGAFTPFGGASCFEDMIAFSRSYSYALTFAGFLGFCMSMKFFKFFSISRRMNTLWLTLSRASSSLLAFTFGFCMLVAGFSFMGQMCFGAQVDGFHNFQSSFSTLLRYPLGDFDYRELARARPDVAAVFFTLYMALIFLVCMNMVVGIITIALEEVNSRLQVDEKWKHAGRTLEQHHMYRFAVFRNACLRCCTRGRLGGDGRDARQLRTEQFYYRLMSEFIDSSELHSRVDLMRYMEDVYKSCAPGSNLYMGINELCSLARDPDIPTEPFCANGHREPKVRANSPSASSAATAAALAAKAAAEREGFVSITFRWLGGSGTGLNAGQRKYGRRGWCRRLLGCCGLDLDGLKSAPGAGSNVKPLQGVMSVSNPLHASSSSSSSGSGSGTSRLPGSTTSAESNPRSSRTIPGGVLGPGLPDPGLTDRSQHVEQLLACHGHRCLAWQLAHAFYAMRDVTCLGPTDRHQFWGDSLRSRSDGSGEKEAASVRATWNVTKINRSNVAQRRILSVEKEKDTYIITTRDMHMRLKRRIPVSQIVQLEASLADPRRCVVYIEAEPVDGSKAGPSWDSYLAITQDTVFDLVFPSPLDRDTFLEKITKYREDVMKAERGLLQAALGGSVAADAAQKLTAAALGSKTADGRPNTGPGTALAAITRMRLTGGAGGVGTITADVAKQAVRDVSTRFAGAPMLAGSAGGGGLGGGGGNPFLAAVTAALRNKGLTPDSSLVNGDTDGASSDLASSVLTGSSALGHHAHAHAHALGGHPVITVGGGEKHASHGHESDDDDDDEEGGGSGSEATGGAAGGKGGGGKDGGHSSEDEEDVFAANPHGGAVIAKNAARRSSMKALVGRHGGLRMVNLMKKMKAQGLLKAAVSAAGGGAAGAGGAARGGLASLASTKGLSGIAALAALRQRESLSLSGDSSTTAEANGNGMGHGAHAAPLGWSPSVHAIGIISPAGSTNSMLSAGSRGGVSPTKAGNPVGAAAKKKSLLQAYRDQQGGGLSSRSLGSASDVGASIAASNAGYRYDADDDRSAPPMSARSDLEEGIEEVEETEGEAGEESGSAVSPVPDAEEYNEGGSDVQVEGSDVSGAEDAAVVQVVEAEAPAPAPSPARRSGRFLAAAISKAAKAAQAEQQAAAQAAAQAQQSNGGGGGGHGKLVKQRSVRFADE